MSFQVLYQMNSPFKFAVTHGGKLQNMKLEVNAAMKITSTRLVGRLVDDPLNMLKTH